MSATAIGEDAERGTSTQCAAGVDVFFGDDPERPEEAHMVSIWQRRRSKVKRRLGAPVRRRRCLPCLAATAGRGEGWRRGEERRGEGEVEGRAGAVSRCLRWRGPGIRRPTLLPLSRSPTRRPVAESDLNAVQREGRDQRMWVVGDVARDWRATATATV
jgi:hypothetical protein